MIKPQRKKHLQVWTLLSLLLPLGIICSWLAIPVQSPVQFPEADETNRLPIIDKQINNNAYTIYIRSDQHRAEKQIEWVNKKPLQTPSAVIYLVDEKVFNPGSAMLIGRIEAKGVYLFPLQLPANGSKDLQLLLYDFIHEKIIDRIKL